MCWLVHLVCVLPLYSICYILFLEGMLSGSVGGVHTTMMDELDLAIPVRLGGGGAGLGLGWGGS